MKATLNHRKSRNLPRLPQINQLAVGSFCFLLIFAGCYKNNKPNYFDDYDFTTKQGIGKIYDKDIQKRFASDKPMFYIKKSDDTVDSIIVYNLYNKSPIYYIKAFYNGDRSVYELSHFDKLFGIQKRFFIFFRNDSSVDYDFITPVVHPDNSIDCQVSKIRNNFSIRINCNYRQVDTTNLVNRLLTAQTIKINKLYATDTSLHPLMTRFTLLNYLGK